LVRPRFTAGHLILNKMTDIERFSLGEEGEDIAVEALNEQGYKIVERNHRNRFGEIDIIAEQDTVVCFIEVKTRSSDSKGSGLDAVSKAKQHKLSQLAVLYLKDNKLMGRKARFDVVSIRHRADGGHHIKIVQNAFELSSKYAY